MNFITVFDAVVKEYSKDIAILVVSALTLNLSLKVKKDDLKFPGKFAERLNKKTRDLLWEYPEYVVTVIEIRDAWTEYENRIKCQGLGGCVEKTLKEIVKFNRNNPDLL